MHTDLLWIPGAAPVLGEGITGREVGLVHLQHRVGLTHSDIPAGMEEAWQAMLGASAIQGLIPTTTAQLLLTMARLQPRGWRR